MENLTLIMLGYNKDSGRFDYAIQEKTENLDYDNHALLVNYFNQPVGKYFKSDFGRIKLYENRLAIYLDYTSNFLMKDKELLLIDMKKTMENYLRNEIEEKQAYLNKLLDAETNFK